jgi:benzodiazapine receptor
MGKPAALFLSVVVCEAVGLAATPFTVAAIPAWYAGLSKPPFSPPNWVFGPVWTLLYLLMGVAVFLVWSKRTEKHPLTRELAWFGGQLVLNFFWSVLFFGLRAPLLGFAEILLLWGAILFTIIGFGRISRPAAWLMVPYLAWVSFAAVLNGSVALLNP